MKIYYKELAYVIMEAEKSQDVQLASGGDLGVRRWQRENCPLALCSIQAFDRWDETRPLWREQSAWLGLVRDIHLFRKPLHRHTWNNAEPGTWHLGPSQADT